jgi:hypothetical protein
MYEPCPGSVSGTGARRPPAVSAQVGFLPGTSVPRPNSFAPDHPGGGRSVGNAANGLCGDGVRRPRSLRSPAPPPPDPDPPTGHPLFRYLAAVRGFDLPAGRSNTSYGSGAGVTMWGLRGLSGGRSSGEARSSARTSTRGSSPLGLVEPARPVPSSLAQPSGARVRLRPRSGAGMLTIGCTTRTIPTTTPSRSGAHRGPTRRSTSVRAGQARVRAPRGTRSDRRASASRPSRDGIRDAPRPFRYRAA